ncbi:MAG: type I secretion C-terminal target domain-containing protein, partial [Burkholderiales bacterium]|nr:type I secretion C-terminal target domain-containing protein [Burkholderiales bacterium]
SSSEKSVVISLRSNFLSTSASLQVKYVDPVPSNTNSLKDLAGNHATNMVLGAWTNDNLSAVDASFTSGKSVQVVGGMGNDTMTGGLANDTFAWFLGDAGTTTGAVDIVKSFGSNSSTDKLDISKLLIGYTGGTNLSQWVTVFSNASGAPSGVSATNTKIVIDVDGSGASSVTQTIWLEGVNLTLTGANLDAQLTALKTSGVLIA